MDEILMALIILTDVILIGVAVGSIRLVRRVRTRFARLQATLVVLLCTAGFVASIQDLGYHATQLGWISESVGKEFVGSFQVILVVGGLLVLAPALLILRDLTVEFARAEAVSDVLVNRLPPGVTIESSGLTKREVEVVAAVGAGHVSDREIAEHLTVSSSTAATHVRNIMRKTGIKRRGDLALLAVDLEEGDRTW